MSILRAEHLYTHAYNRAGEEGKRERERERERESAFYFLSVCLDHL